MLGSGAARGLAHKIGWKQLTRLADPNLALLFRRRSFGSIKKQRSPVAIPGTQISARGGSAFGRKNLALAALNNKINKLVQNNKVKLKSFQRLVSIFKAKVYKGAQRLDPGTPNMFNTVMQALYTMEYEIAQSKIKEADIIITPDTGDIAVLEFYRAKEAILEGYKAAKEVISKNKIGNGYVLME